MVKNPRRYKRSFHFFPSVAEKFGYARHLAKNVLKWIYVNQKGDRRVSHRDCRKRKSRVVLTSPKMNYGLTNREKTFNGNIECRNSRIRRFMSEFVKLGIRIGVFHEKRRIFRRSSRKTLKFLSFRRIPIDARDRSVYRFAKR